MLDVVNGSMQSSLSRPLEQSDVGVTEEMSPPRARRNELTPTFDSGIMRRRPTTQPLAVQGRRSQPGSTSLAQKKSRDRGVLTQQKPVSGTPSTLATDLIQYFESASARDVEIICQDTTFWSNKILLAARSPVFNCMLGPSSSFAERKAQRIEIHEASPTIVQAYLDFIRTDTAASEKPRAQDPDAVNKLTDELLQLYELADKFETSSLMKRCSALICKRIDRKNVLRIFSRIEDFVDCDEIRLKCMECLQSICGADLLSMIRGEDIWGSLRRMPVEIEKLTSRTDNRKTPNSLSFEFMCCPHESVASLKDRLRDVVGSPVIKLIFSGTLLENSRTLADYGISAGSTIFVLDAQGKVGHTSLLSQPPETGGDETPELILRSQTPPNDPRL